MVDRLYNDLTHFCMVRFVLIKAHLSILLEHIWIETLAELNRFITRTRYLIYYDNILKSLPEREFIEHFAARHSGSRVRQYQGAELSTKNKIVKSIQNAILKLRLWRSETLMLAGKLIEKTKKNFTSARSSDKVSGRVR